MTYNSPGKLEWIGALVSMALLGSLVGGGLSGCARAVADETAATAANQATLIKAVQPERTTLSKTIAVTGSLDPWERVLLRARVRGYVEQVNVDIGDKVKAGDVLAVLAVPELTAEVDRAKALFVGQKARAEAARTISGLRKRTFSRLRRLMDTDADSVAADQVDRAESRTVNEQSKMRFAEADEQAQSADLQRLEALANLRVIRAPFDGTVVRRTVDRGALVGVGNDAPLFEMVSVEKLRARFSLPEEAALQVKEGTKVVVSLPASPRIKPRTVAISRSAGEVDADSRTVRFEADVMTPGGKWLPGLYIHVKVALETREKALTLPAKALMASKKGSHVFTCNKGVAHKVAIKIGEDDGAIVEVLSGVSDNDLVVLEGKDKLKEGGPCRVK